MPEMRRGKRGDRMMNIDEILADIQARCDAGRPPCGDTEYICVSRKDIEQLAAEYRKAMAVVDAAQYRQMLINNRRELRLRNRPGEFIPELGDLIVSIGQADIRLEQALAGLERGGE